MPNDTEENRRASLAASRAKDTRMRDRMRRRLQRSRQARMAVSPPNGAEYALAGAIALVNDLLDYLLVAFSITGIVLLLIKVLDFVIAFILGAWALIRGVKKMKGGHRTSRRIWRMVFSFIIELIPFLGEILPTWTISVYLAWREHKKVYNEAQAGRAEAPRGEEARGGEEETEGAGMELAEEAA